MLLLLAVFLLQFRASRRRRRAVRVTKCSTPSSYRQDPQCTLDILCRQQSLLLLQLNKQTWHLLVGWLVNGLMTFDPHLNITCSVRVLLISWTWPVFFPTDFHYHWLIECFICLVVFAVFLKTDLITTHIWSEKMANLVHRLVQLLLVVTLIGKSFWWVIFRFFDILLPFQIIPSAIAQKNWNDATTPWWQRWRPSSGALRTLNTDRFTMMFAGKSGKIILKF